MKRFNIALSIFVFLALLFSSININTVNAQACGNCSAGGCQNDVVGGSCGNGGTCVERKNQPACGDGNIQCRCAEPPATPTPLPVPTTTTTITPPPAGGLPRQPKLGPVPSPTGVPCDETRPNEFHSLRPYQASPCDQTASELALFCGNDLIIPDPLTVEREVSCIRIGFVLSCYNYYFFEGNRIDPAPPYVCSADNNAGTWNCWYAIARTKDFVVDLEDAYLPIMGNTERVVNSIIQPAENPPDYFDDPIKVNEYVSWYLNGVNGRAEYDPPDTDTDDGRNKIVSFSGPLKKLLSFDSQVLERIEEIDSAGATRHNQIVACRNGSDPTACYPGSATRTRLSNFSVLPPLMKDYPNSNDYWTAYNNWRGSILSRLFQYIPFSSTEDRKGEVEAQAPPTQPINADAYLTNVVLVNQQPADLFFAHMQESAELADLLQQTFVPQGDLKDNLTFTQSEPPEFCHIKEIRNNPGDNLFATEISGTVNYTANFQCHWTLEGDGRLCALAEGECRPKSSLPNDQICTVFDPIDCGPDDYCFENCRNFPSSTGHLCEENPGYNCVPDSWSCGQTAGMTYCPSGYQCGYNCTAEPDLVNPYPLREECLTNIYVRLNTITKTPKADEVWARLVAGPAGVFKRWAPKIEIGAPIEALLDIPAASPADYSSTDGTIIAGNPVLNRPGSEAEIYFPHIGGIHQYFLKCLQTILRPQGFGEFCPSGTPSTAGAPIVGDCPVVPDSEIPAEYLGARKANFVRIVNIWAAGCTCSTDVNTECEYNLVNECYNYVVKRSLEEKVNPAYALTTWAHESAASNYCYNPNAQDFGINVAGLEHNILAQLEWFLTLPFASRYTSCMQDPRWDDPMKGFLCQYKSGKCDPVNETGCEFYYNMLDPWWIEISGCGSIASGFGISAPYDLSCP